MPFERKAVLYPVLLSSIFLLSGCPFDDDDENEEIDPNANAASVCLGDAKEVSLSDDRTLCVNLDAFKAEAPFMAGFHAPGKVTHTVFVTDSDGNAIDVSNDDVVTSIKQYPMMYMNAGHTHSAPYQSADISAAEYGAYNFDTYYLMPSEMMDGTSMGRWEYRVKVVDNNGTADDDADDKTHTVTFEPTVNMIMSSKAFRAVGKNENDKFKNAMGMMPERQYSAWLDSLGKVSEGAADVKIYLTTIDMDHSDMAMGKVRVRAEGDHDMHGDMGGEDSQTFPGVHAPMDMMGSTMTLTLHDTENTAVDVSTVDVEVSTDDGTTWTMLMAGMTHDELGYYSASVPMTAGEVTMQVKVTVNGNVMTKTGVMADGTDAADIPVLKFSASE